MIPHEPDQKLSFLKNVNFQMIYAFQSKTSSPLDICPSKQNTKLSLASKTNLGEKGFQSVKIYRILSWSVFPSKHLKCMQVRVFSCLIQCWKVVYPFKIPLPDAKANAEYQGENANEAQ